MFVVGLKLFDVFLDVGEPGFVGVEYRLDVNGLGAENVVDVGELRVVVWRGTSTFGLQRE